MPQDQDDIKGADAMKQASTPGPLTVEGWIKNTGKKPHNLPERFDVLFDDRALIENVTGCIWTITGQGDVAWWRPSLASTAPVEASGSDDPLREHVRAMQRMATAYLVPEDYTDRNGDVTFHGTDTNSREYKYDQAGRRAKAFANDMIYMLDGPEERAAMSALRPQPSGETRESIHDTARRLFAKEYPGRDYDLIGASARVGWMESAWEEREALLSARPAPVASGGQHSSGEMRVVPRKPTDRDVSEILYNINRKRRTDDELSEADVREVMDNYFYNVGQPAPAPVADNGEG